MLSELIYLADLAHYSTSGYAVSIGGTREHQFAELAKLARASAPSQFHHSHFDIAEAPDGTPAAAVAGFDRTAANDYATAALTEIGWTTPQIEALFERIAPLEEAYPEEAPGTWTIEHVATLPAYRGQGLIRQLIAKVLERGADQGFTLAIVDVFDGNARARAIYEDAGFRRTTVFGHAALRQVFDRDPLIRLVRPLRRSLPIT